MNISRKWLGDYVRLDCDDAVLCHKLTMSGIEVEAVESARRVPAGVIAAKIVERKPHPDSDHLSVCQVFDGKETLQIVCGAPNCDAGCVVPLATIGTIFNTPEGEFKIKKSKLRGVESNGMMCSAAELGLSEDNSGLMILPPDTGIGVPLEKLFPGDTQIEVEVTPNRPDWLSMWGVARDVSCLLGVEAKLPEITVPECDTPAPELVTIEDRNLCSRYIGRVIRNVKIGPSPKWMVERLESVGLRSINNVVDVTNFVLMELGQPLHTFDLNKLAGKRVVVRRARPGEKLTVLDGTAVELSEKNLVIADADKPAALAGVMGGLDSGVTDDTTDILLESAIFDPVSIRTTSRQFNVASDSSYRFERGVDWDMTELAAKRACQLILATAGGELATAAVDVTTAPRPREKTIICRFDRIRSLIGSGASNERMIEIFKALRLEVSEVTPDSCKVVAPIFRRDLEREADLAEEVARIDGLDKIPQIPVLGRVCHPVSEDAWRDLEVLRDRVIALGFCECVHYSIVSQGCALSDSRFNEAQLVRLDNPISPDNAVMRPSLFGVLLGAVERNVSRGSRDLALFELGKVFCADANVFPEERCELGLVLTGRRHPERFSAEREEKFDFYDLKGALEELFDEYRIRNFRFVKLAGDSRFREGCAAEIQINGRTAGAVGEVSPKFASAWRTTDKVFIAQIEMSAIVGAAGKVVTFKELAQFPSTTRDVALVAPAAMEHAEIVDFVRKCKLPDLESVQLFDVFVDDALKAAGRKSMAYQFTFRNRSRTLKDNEVNSVMEKLRGELAAKLKLELR